MAWEEEDSFSSRLGPDERDLSSPRRLDDDSYLSILSIYLSIYLDDR